MNFLSMQLYDNTCTLLLLHLYTLQTTTPNGIVQSQNVHFIQVIKASTEC